MFRIEWIEWNAPKCRRSLAQYYYWLFRWHPLLSVVQSMLYFPLLNGWQFATVGCRLQCLISILLYELNSLNSEIGLKSASLELIHLGDIDSNRFDSMFYILFIFKMFTIVSDNWCFQFLFIICVLVSKKTILAIVETMFRLCIFISCAIITNEVNSINK